MPTDATRTLAAMAPDLSRGAIRRRLKHLPAGLLGCAVVLVAGAVAGGVWAGTPGLEGAVAGTLLVAASFTVSSVIIAWADSIDPKLVLPVGLMTYALKFTLLGVGLVAALQSTWRGLTPMALAIAGATFAWVVAHACGSGARALPMWNWTTGTKSPGTGHPMGQLPDSYSLRSGLFDEPGVMWAIAG